jgi:hypothetical protein
MSRIARRVKRVRTARRTVGFALDLTTIIVLVAALFAILHIFSVTTMDSRQYYDWYLSNRDTSGSLLATLALTVAAVGALYVADIVRPKPGRVAIATRLFQLLLIGSMVSVSLIQWGMLLPHEPVAGPARDWQLALQRTPFFYAAPVWIDLETEEPNPRPVWQDETMWHVSPFAEKAGVLRAETEDEVTAIWLAQSNAFWNAARPFAITEPPQRINPAPQEAP